MSIFINFKINSVQFGSYLFFKLPWSPRDSLSCFLNTYVQTACMQAYRVIWGFNQAWDKHFLKFFLFLDISQKIEKCSKILAPAAPKFGIFPIFRQKLEFFPKSHPPPQAGHPPLHPWFEVLQASPRIKGRCSRRRVRVREFVVEGHASESQSGNSVSIITTKKFWVFFMIFLKRKNFEKT